MLRSVPRRLPRRLPTLSSTAGSPSRFALRPFTCAYPRMTSSSLPSVEPPVSSALPGDSYQLLSTADKAGAAEDALYEQQIRDVEAWWNSPRYEGSEEDVIPVTEAQLAEITEAAADRELKCRP